MSGWEKSPDYGGNWGGWWSTAAAIGVIAALVFALVSCSQAAEPHLAPESAAAAQDAQPSADTGPRERLHGVASKPRRFGAS